MWFQHGEDDLSDITFVAKSVGSFVFSSVISSLPSCVRYSASDLNKPPSSSLCSVWYTATVLAVRSRNAYLPCDASVASSLPPSVLELCEESVLFEDEGVALVDIVAVVGGVEPRLIPSKRTSSSWSELSSPDELSDSGM